MRTHTYYGHQEAHSFAISLFGLSLYIHNIFTHERVLCKQFDDEPNQFVCENKRSMVCCCVCVCCVHIESNGSNPIREDIATLKILMCISSCFFWGYFKSFFLRLAKHKEDKPYNINFNHHL